jgi:ABC-type sugar transport system permease subunit
MGTKTHSEELSGLESVRESLPPLGGLAYLTPLAIFYIPFLIVPAVVLFALSLFAGPGIGNMRFVGLANYQFMLNDGVIFLAVQNSIIYTIGHTVICVGGGLLIAVAITATYRRVQRFLRFFYMVPMAMMGVAVGFIWSYIYNTRTGVLNALIQTVAPEVSLRVLGNPELVLSGIIMVGGWKGLGFYTTIWMIGLMNVDERYYEAARLEGVSSWVTFRHITLPLTKSIGMFLVLVSVIGSMKMFAYFWVMTEGGPAHASEVLITYMYKLAFLDASIGKAATVGVVLFLLILVITIGLERFVGLQTDFDKGV